MKKKIVIIMLLLFSLCGCTKRFTIENKEDNSQKTYVSNILCKPETKELQKIYRYLESLKSNSNTINKSKLFFIHKLKNFVKSLTN